MSRLVALFILALPAMQAAADTFDVTRGDDPLPGACLPADCSLREALASAQASPGADTIRLGAGQYFVTRGDLDAYGDLVIEGAGSTATDVVGSGASSTLRVAAQSDVTLRGVRFVSAGGTAIAADLDHSTTTLDDVDVPVGEVAAGGADDSGYVELHVRHSSIGSIVGCIAAAGLCDVSGSVVGSVGAVGEHVDLRFVRSEARGPSTGVIAFGAGAVLIEDSTIRDAAEPLQFLQVSIDDAPDVWIRRTRFVGNGGPIRASREGMIHLDDVEFSDNVVDAAHLADGDPAVLLADDRGAWRINRALFSGNRGAGNDGAVLRVLGGANVVLNQATFVDNTYHPDAGVGFGHAIGVYATGSAATILWIFHATMRRAASLPVGTTGSLLTVRGATANVRVYNSLLDGTCAFGGGGAIFQAQGSIESPADSCSFDEADNDVGVSPLQLHLGPFGDHGGFTRSYEPIVGSVLRDAANATWCRFSPVDQRGYLRPADGVACDVGAVEAGSTPDLIFADGFG